MNKRKKSVLLIFITLLFCGGLFCEELDGINNELVLAYKNKNYSKAAQLAEKGLKIAEKSGNNQQVAAFLKNLAHIYKAQEKYSKAESYLKRALTISEKSFGEKDPKVASLLNSFGLLYQEMGRYVEAESLFKRAMDIRREVYGDEHPQVGVLYHNLGNIYKEQEKYDQAEYYLLRAYDIIEKNNGADHPNMIYPLDQLAYIYRVRKDFTKAESFYRRVLRIKEKTFGDESIETANAKNNLGALYLTQNKPEAGPLLNEALRTAERVLGTDHPLIANILDNLARYYKDTGNEAKANQMAKRAIKIRSRNS